MRAAKDTIFEFTFSRQLEKQKDLLCVGNKYSYSNNIVSRWAPSSYPKPTLQQEEKAAAPQGLCFKAYTTTKTLFDHYE